MSCAGNVMLASTSTVPHGFAAKVSDFGLAREMDIQSKIATNTTGTVTYMPPETIADGMVSKVCGPFRDIPYQNCARPAASCYDIKPRRDAGAAQA